MGGALPRCRWLSCASGIQQDQDLLQLVKQPCLNFLSSTLSVLLALASVHACILPDWIPVLSVHAFHHARTSIGSVSLHAGLSSVLLRFCCHSCLLELRCSFDKQLETK